MNQSAAKNCFGDLETVFPLGREGLREISARCWDCIERVECLRLAVSKGEMADLLKEEVAVRHDPDGLAGSIRRWSRRKAAAEKKERP